MLLRNQSQVLFGKGLALDIGASGGGSSKFQEIDNAGTPRGESYTFPMRSFLNGDDFVKAVAENANKVPNVSPPHEKLDVIVANLPGQPTRPGVMAAFVNLKTEQGERPRHIDFNQLGKHLGNPSARLIAVNDLVGGIAEVVHQISQKFPDRFKTGEKITYAVSGGGLGMLDADIGKKSLNIASSECGYIQDFTRKDKSLESLLISPSSVTGLKVNFFKRLKESINSPMPHPGPLPGETVTQYKSARKLFPHLTKDQYRKAANQAIDEYMDGLKTAFLGRIHNGSTLAVLSGPVVIGVKNYLQKRPEYFKKEIEAYDQKFPGQDRPVFEKIFLNRAYLSLNPGMQELYKVRNFDVITDIHIPNNTTGARHLIQGHHGSRGDSYKIPLTKLTHTI